MGLLREGTRLCTACARALRHNESKSFPDSGYKNLDFSVPRTGTSREVCGLSSRAEFFNILNHPNFANPYGGQNGYGLNDPGAGTWCGCATPDIAAANPAVGSGGPRSVQLGLKLIF